MITEEEGEGLDVNISSPTPAQEPEGEPSEDMEVGVTGREGDDERGGDKQDDEDIVDLGKEERLGACLYANSTATFMN